MNSLQKAGKSKSSKTKKGGNFLGTVGDLVAPTGWGSFATAAALVGIDRVDAALRRGKSTKSSAKKGGMMGGFSLRDLENIQQKIIKLDSDSEDITDDYQDFLIKYKQYVENKIKGNFIPDGSKSRWSIFSEMTQILLKIILKIDNRKQTNTGNQLKKDIEKIKDFIKTEQNESNKFNKFNRALTGFSKFNRTPNKFSSQYNQKFYENMRNIARFQREKNDKYNNKFRQAKEINKIIQEKKIGEKSISSNNVKRHFLMYSKI